MQYSLVRYLHSKKPVDDRSINRHVLEGFASALKALNAPPKILELGAGVGTMVSRLADWGVVPCADYTLVDRDGESLAAARQHLLDWGGGAVTRVGDDAVTVQREGGLLRVRFVHHDALAFCLAPENAVQYDAVTANAVLDLMDLRPALASLWRACRAGGLFWFTINFDGETILLPEEPLDALVMSLFHRTMDERITDGLPAGDSKTGRRLLTAIPESGASIEQAGSSDWVVFPKAQGYDNDEAYFLHHIVDTIDSALRHFDELDLDRFAAWVKRRHEQIDSAQLSYIAHQLDVLGRAPTR